MRHRRADGAKLRELRIERQLTQKEVGLLANVRRDTLCSIEAGRYQPGDLLAHRLAAVYKCRVEAFIATDHDAPTDDAQAGAA